MMPFQDKPPGRWANAVAFMAVVVLAVSLMAVRVCGVAHAAAPEIPTNPAAYAGDTRVVLTWTAPASGDAPTGYKYRQRNHTDGGSWGNWISTGSTDTQYQVTGLTNDKEYRFSVLASNADGDGPGTSYVAATPATSSTPGAPTDLTATGGNAQVALSWTAPASDGGSTIYSYDVGQEYPAVDSGNLAIPAHDKTSTAAVSLPSLADNNAVESSTASFGGTLYKLKRYVPTLTINVNNFPVQGNTQCVRYSDTAPSGKDSGQQFIGGTCGWTGFTWSNQQFTANLNKANQPAGRYFWITGGDPGQIGGGSSTIRVRATATYVWESTGSTDTSYTKTGLSNGTSYSFKIRATNANGSGAESSAVSATPSTTPGAPTGLTATAGNTRVELSWTAPADTGGSAITGYEYQQDGGSWVSTGSTNASYTKTGLSNGTSYSFKIRATNANGSGAESSAASATPSTTPGAPTNLTATGGNEQAILSLNAPADDGGSAVTGYEYQARIHDPGNPRNTDWSDFTSAGNVTQVVVTRWPGNTPVDFAKGDVVRFRVRACNVNGCGATAPVGTPNYVSATITGVPGQVTNLSATAGNAQVSLSWTAPADTGGSAITGYEYQQDGGSWTSTGGGTNTAFTKTGLTNSQSYSFRIRAVNANGGGAESASTSATPIPPPPTPTPTPAPTPTPTPVPLRAVAYLGTVQVAVGNESGTYGYKADGYGGLVAGRLPGALLIDGRDRTAAEITVSSANSLKLTYAEETDGLFKSAFHLRWLRAQLRSADGIVRFEGNLWNATSCGDRSICIAVGSGLAAYDGQVVGLDFFDAQSEARVASQGGKQAIIFDAGAVAADDTGFDSTNGVLMSGLFPGEWFTDGRPRTPEKVSLSHGAANRRLELAYAAADSTGLWKQNTNAYRKFRLSLRDRDGELLQQWDVQDALDESTESVRRCGDASPARRICLPYDDDVLDLTGYQGQALVLLVEDITWFSMLKKTPGGPVGAQLGLGLFGAVAFGIVFRRAKSPQREWIILAAGAGAMALPAAFGFGDLFWSGAVIIIAILAGAGWFFMNKAR